jgi:hypothetical protein
VSDKRVNALMVPKLSSNRTAATVRGQLSQRRKSDFTFLRSLRHAEMPISRRLKKGCRYKSLLRGRWRLDMKKTDLQDSNFPFL